MFFSRVRMEEPVSVTGGKVALDMSLVLIVDVVLKITLNLESFLLGDTFSLIKSDEIDKIKFLNTYVNLLF